MTVPVEDRLREIVGEAHVLVDRDVVASYESDWTGRFRAAARCVVRPGDTAEVAAVVAACREAGIELCIQGGNTGLVGGSVPVDGAVVLSTRRLSEIGEVDPLSAQVTVGAGATLSAVQAAVRKAGFDVGVDFAARESCTVGGMASTNAGGERVLRYGTMRAQVAGVDAVMPDGSVVSRLAGLPKDNTGYDIVGLLAGAEGTLGVLTKLRLRLVPLLAGRAVALVAVGSTRDAVDLVVAARSLPSLEAAELFYADGLELVCGHTGLPAPFGEAHPAYVLLECADRADPSELLLAALEAAGDAVRDATVASDARGRHALWAYRESHTESINAAGVPVKLDVAVPIGELPALVDALPAAIEAAAPGSRLVLFGHVNEGNLHVNVLDALEHDEAVTEAVLKLVSSYGGSISAEHGVGRHKREWLGLSRSAQEIEVMRAIKGSLDPNGLLNPGVLL
ncbi:MAG TPA: FAD-binding oxidoreductase [Mycobacteriales bacterium]|nr:FAD-binding oxidoreductase [Mycobacteriales bacterium]